MLTDFLRYGPELENPFTSVPPHHHDRHRAHHQMHPQWDKWAHGHTRLTDTKDDSAILGNAKLKAARGPHRFTGEQAVRLIIEALKKDNTLDNHRSSSPIACLVRRDELPFVIFNEIDQTLFSKILKGNVVLKWSSLPNSLPGMTTKPGGKHPRITIELSNKFLYRDGVYKEDGRGHIVATLLHQMVHAYLLQCCDYKNPDTAGSQHDLGHGREFSTIINLIHKRLMPIEYMEHPAMFGCRSWQLDTEGPARGRLPARRTYAAEAGSSTCLPNVQEHTVTKCKYYQKQVEDTTLVPKLCLEDKAPVDTNKIPRPITQYIHYFDGDERVAKLRSERDLTNTIELHFQNRAFPLSIVGVSKWSSIAAKVTTDKVLVVSGSDEETFRRLFDFFERGGYSPATADNTSTENSKNLGSLSNWGPPKIAEYQTCSEESLLQEIKVYRLGITIGFSELKKYALQRLYAQKYACNDPCAVLELIYYGTMNLAKNTDGAPKADPKKASEIQGPDGDIRQWVRAWLQVPSSDDEKFANRLETLQEHSSSEERYAQLRQKGGELITDIDIVEAELAKESDETAEMEKGGTTKPLPMQGPQYGYPHRYPTPPYDFGRYPLPYMAYPGLAAPSVGGFENRDGATAAPMLKVPARYSQAGLYPEWDDKGGFYWVPRMPGGAFRGPCGAGFGTS